MFLGFRKGYEGTREGSSLEQSRRGWTPESGLPWRSRRNKKQAQAKIKANCSQPQCVLSYNCSLFIIQGMLENSPCALSKGHGGNGQHVPPSPTAGLCWGQPLAHGSDGSSCIPHSPPSAAADWESLGFRASPGNTEAEFREMAPQTGTVPAGQAWLFCHERESLWPRRSGWTPSSLQGNSSPSTNQGRAGLDTTTSLLLTRLGHTSLGLL